MAIASSVPFSCHHAGEEDREQASSAAREYPSLSSIIGAVTLGLGRREWGVRGWFWVWGTPLWGCLGQQGTQGVEVFEDTDRPSLSNRFGF